MGSLILLIILILINGYFAASEIAFISLNDAKIDLMVKEGNKKAKKIKKMLQNPSKFLATIQIGITFAGFLSSAFASEKFASNIAPILNSWLPTISIGAWNNIAIILITIILSYFTLIFGELVPKRLAMKYYEKIAFGTVGVIRFISIITAPFVKFLTFSTNIISKLFGISGTEEETVTEEEIRMMVDVGEEKGTIDKQESEMINNVFEFNDKTVSEIMVPRNDVYALDMNLSISKVIDEITEDKEFRYSRIPVYDENIDEIEGIVYLKDILMTTKDKRTKIKSLVKEAYFVPETKQVNELFAELRKNRLITGYMIVAVALTCFMLVGYVALQTNVTTRMANVASLENELSTLNADNNAAESRIATTTNLSDIKEKAINDLGMVYATSSQIVYYSVDGSDYMSQYHDIP